MNETKDQQIERLKNIIVNLTAELGTSPDLRDQLIACQSKLAAGLSYENNANTTNQSIEKKKDANLSECVSGEDKVDSQYPDNINVLVRIAYRLDEYWTDTTMLSRDMDYSCGKEAGALIGTIVSQMPRPFQVLAKAIEAAADQDASSVLGAEKNELVEAASKFIRAWDKYD